MLALLTRNWWLVALRGVLAVLFGIMAFVWPGASLLTLVFLYGGYALMDGIATLISAISGRQQEKPLWQLILAGVAGVVAGLFAFFWPGITTVVLLIFIGAWAIVKGVLEIVAAIRLRKEIENEWLLGLAGALSMLFGVLLLSRPGVGALAVLWIIAGYAIAFGVVAIVFALRLRKLGQALKPHVKLA